MGKRSSAFQLTASPIPIVRIGLIGMGRRGIRTLERFAHIDGVEFVAIADLLPIDEDAIRNLLLLSGRPIPRFYSGARGAEEVCKLTDVDLILICTDWYSHTELTLMALNLGKHVGVEVPACVSIEDCYRILEAGERMQRHCFLMENCCYDPFALRSLQLFRQGLLGEIKHCEGAYIHNLNPKQQTGGEAIYRWMNEQHPYICGNAYPTHAIGPIAHLLGIHRGDAFESVYSLSSSPNLPFSQRVNTTLIRTKEGKSILLQMDIHTPRPYSRLQTICATKGYLTKNPEIFLQIDSFDKPLVGEEAESYLEHYQHPIEKRWGAEGRDKQVENVMNYMMDARLIYCLREGLPLDIDLYDTVEWSALIALTAQSEQINQPIPFPNFTEGISTTQDGWAIWE